MKPTNDTKMMIKPVSDVRRKWVKKSRDKVELLLVFLFTEWSSLLWLINTHWEEKAKQFPPTCGVVVRGLLGSEL